VIETKCNKTLPSNWEWHKAQECMDIRDGTHDSPKYISEGYPLVTSKNLVNGKIDFSTCSFISKEDHEAISKRSAVDNGDILYAMIGTIGNPVIVEKSHEFSIKNVALFKFNKKSVFNKYIYYFLNSEIAKRQFNSNSRGGTQKFISLTNIRDLRIPLPPLETQKQIAQVLETADQLRKDCQQVEQELNALAQSVFLEMFGDPVTNPKGWNKQTAETCIDLLTGFPFKSKDYSDDKNDVYLCGGLIISPSGIEWHKANYWKSNKIKGLEKYWVCVGDIVLAMDRPWISSGLKIHKITNQDKESLLVQRTARIRGENINQDFLYFLFKHSAFERHACTTETTVPHISPNDIKSYQLIIPPLNLQNKFSVFIKVLEEQKQHNKEKSQQFDDLFNTLLQKAFKGELVLKSTEHA